MTLELCWICEEPTGKAGACEDSLYDSDGAGPYCEDCLAETEEADDAE